MFTRREPMATTATRETALALFEPGTFSFLYRCGRFMLNRTKRHKHLIRRVTNRVLRLVLETVPSDSEHGH